MSEEKGVNFDCMMSNYALMQGARMMIEAKRQIIKSGMTPKHIDPLHEAYAFRCVHINPGRRTGKTELMRELITSNDAILSANKQVDIHRNWLRHSRFEHETGYSMYPALIKLSGVENEDNFTMVVTPNSEILDIVYIDEPRLVFRRLPYDVGVSYLGTYLTRVYANRDYLIVMLGE